MVSWWVKFTEKFTRNIQNGCVYIGSGPINVKIKKGEKTGMVSDELVDVKSYVFICLGSIEVSSQKVRVDPTYTGFRLFLPVDINLALAA